MTHLIIFSAGAVVGIGAYKLYEYLKNNHDNQASRYAESLQQGPFVPINHPSESNPTNTSNLDITPLEQIMRQYNVDITAPNCLYILCNQIKSHTYKKLLDDIINNTNTGEELITLIKNVHIETFTYPNSTTSTGRYFISIKIIDQLLSASSIVSDNSDPKAKVEILINTAYAYALDRLKKNFGIEFNNLIKAYEDGCELQSYYNDLIKEIKISRNF